MSKISQPRLNMDNLKEFAVVVEGDVAFTMKHPIEVENVIAALRSNPQIIEVPDEVKNVVTFGWTFDGTNFIPPSE
jgi:hypothetical protein